MDPIYETGALGQRVLVERALRERDLRGRVRDVAVPLAGALAASSAEAEASGDVVRVTWMLHGVQAEFVTSPSRFSLYIGGIGSGKTYAGAVRAILYAGEHPGALGLIGAPTYPMLRDATQRTFFELLPRPLIAEHRKSEQRLRLRNGSEILFRSLDEPDRLRGLNLAWFWLDEAPLCGYYAWQVLKGRLRQRGFLPAAWATGTPRGRDGYFCDFERQPRPHHALFRAATQANAAHLPPDYIAGLNYTGALYDQEVLGLFSAFAGLVYHFDATPSGHLRAAAPGATWAEVIGGVDWGYTNPAAALVFGLDGDGRAWQLDEFYQRRAALDERIVPAILALTRAYGVRRWYCGPDEPEHIAALAAALARDRLPAVAQPADNSVRAGIQTITSLLAQRDDGTRGLYVHPRCVHTLAEYGSYQYAPAAVAGMQGIQGAESVEGALSEQPLKQNDHAMDATRYALHTHLSRTRATERYLAHLQRRLRQHGDV